MKVIKIKNIFLLIIISLSTVMHIDSGVESKKYEGKVSEMQLEIDRLLTPINGVIQNGQLSVNGTQLVNQLGELIQLRGLSSHGILWYPEYTNYRAIRTTKEYGANVFRIAMYTEGYIKDMEGSKKALFAAVENTIGADMYAIIDWHILKDGNPNTYADEAEDFFREASLKYANKTGVIYEICNEPNGGTTWQDVKKYANRIIPVIRENSPNAIIIVGTTEYSTGINNAADDPLEYDNIMYSYHYYSNVLDGNFEDNILYALQKKTPIFVTEWGLNKEKKTGLVDYGKGEKFIEFLNIHDISWINWSLTNKDEVYSVIDSSVTELSNWTMDQLTENGKFIFKALSRNDE